MCVVYLSYLVRRSAGPAQRGDPGQRAILLWSSHIRHLCHLGVTQRGCPQMTMLPLTEDSDVESFIWMDLPWTVLPSVSPRVFCPLQTWKTHIRARGATSCILRPQEVTQERVKAIMGYMCQQGMMICQPRRNQGKWSSKLVESVGPYRQNQTLPYQIPGLQLQSLHGQEIHGTGKSMVIR